MFKIFKKRVKSLGESVHGRTNDNHGIRSEDRNDTSDKLNTPARRYTGDLSKSPPQFSSSPSGNTENTSSSDRSFPERSNRKSGRPPSSSKGNTRKKKGSDILATPLEDLDLVSKIAHLAPFDICIEASDALAAASGLSDHRHAMQEESIMNELRIDERTGLPSTCILVSPDGYMLLIPPSVANNTRKENKSHQEISTIELETELKSRVECEGGGNTGETPNKDMENLDTSIDNSIQQNHEDDVATIEDENHSDSAANFSELRLNCKDDYESSIYVGHDLHPEGDKALNGFSAKGWSIPATSLALEQTEQSLNSFAHFCEQMILSRKESAARTAFACDNLREAAASMQKGKIATQDSSDSWVVVDPHTVDFVVTPARTGPLLAQGSTMAIALTAVEEYYISESEKEAHRWRTASLQRDELLPKIHDAVDQLHERSLKRQLALEESSRRVKLLEERVTALQHVAEGKWQAVYDAEERVTDKLQKLMEERRKLREISRLEKLRQEEAIRLKETASMNKGNATLGATNKEIWDIVSSMVDASDDPGSFEPIDYPTAPLSAPRDKSAEGVTFDDLAANSIHTEFSTGSSNSESSHPIASREEVAMELGLPQLRAAALEADEAIRDTADTLLNVLSTFDTIRRSARVAAETCLLSASNAQSNCLQTWIQLERISLEDRLAGLNVLEEKLKTINVRADLDSYICSDRKERGGSNHLGDDDDGGIASALAVLSSHVDGIERDSVECRMMQPDATAVIDDDNETISQAKMEEAIEHLFKDKEEFRLHGDSHGLLKESVQVLCKIGSSKSRAQRSSLCYALNAKRSSNARMHSKTQFDALCNVFDAILSGCNAEVEVGGVSNAKMCMMLSQTFYMDGQTGDAAINSIHNGNSPRSSRIYVKNQLMQHPIWSKDDYWDIALSQQISESLTHSGVMSNFERSNYLRRRKSEFAQARKTYWYDLSQTERLEAASQVHAVVFAQLGALAHSMLEFGCGLERACSFVRRMSIRNQLPSSHRTMLLMHLMERDDIDTN